MNTELLCRILTYIDEHIREKMRLEDLAQFAGYSPFYFSKLFSDVMGISITEYICMRKLQYSLVELLAGKKILDVSLEFGFETHEGYTRSFTRLYGSLPSVAKRSIITYQVPKIVVPDVDRKENIHMKECKTGQNELYQMAYAVLSETLREARDGFVTEATIEILEDGSISLSDNGRGLPFREDKAFNKQLMNEILIGNPLTASELRQISSISDLNLKTVNSLCSHLELTVYRDNVVYRQRFAQGIAQGDITFEECVHEQGTRIVMKPDDNIFSNEQWSRELFEKWFSEQDLGSLKISYIGF